jgi:hypothetical protein
MKSKGVVLKRRHSARGQFLSLSKIKSDDGGRWPKIVLIIVTSFMDDLKGNKRKEAFSVQKPI